ncbi:response regulator transcription factor [Petroclostridium sp. X23]|uniref:response regulator n=1 Tax=Petroclostridium sp. X23 TaxID=3045146 RepID=UPI0024AD466E|nr:response regulator transcription factor [Petroclostridium sp. X23]WHH57891.1 response regulator transcription factor [Petroclostridium sp. X23]
MRILLADDEKYVRSAVRIILEQQSGLNIVGEAAELDGLIEQISEKKADLVLLDWELPDSSISGVIPMLRKLSPNLKIIAMSSRPEASKAALTAGVDAFVSKGDQPERLLEAIRNIRVELLSSRFSGGESNVKHV